MIKPVKQKAMGTGPLRLGKQELSEVDGKVTAYSAKEIPDMWEKKKKWILESKKIQNQKWEFTGRF